MTDNSLNEKNDQILQYISQLQEEELRLYKSLDDPNVSSQDKELTINRINQISQIRLNLYGSIKNVLDTYQTNISDSQNTLNQQVIAIKIMDKELNQAKKTLDKLDENKSNKMRMVEINTYYGKRYGTISTLMITIIICCIPLIILATLRNWSLLPSLLYSLLVGIVFLISFVVIGYQLVDIWSRDNMNWDEYDWNFNPNNAPTETVSTTGSNPWPEINITCIGAECCTDGTTFDENLKKCVSSTGATQTQDAFGTIEKYAKMPVKTEGFNLNFMPKKALLSKYK